VVPSTLLARADEEHQIIRVAALTLATLCRSKDGFGLRAAVPPM